MKKETQEIRVNRAEEEQVLIPMIIDRDSIEEHGMIVGVEKSQIRKWRVGNRKVDVVLIPGTKVQYDAVMSSYSAEFKAEDRDKRCEVSNGKGKLIRCPESNKCSKCPYATSLDKKNFGTLTFSCLSAENAEGEEVDFEAVTPVTYGSEDIYFGTLNELISRVQEIDPNYGRILKLLSDGFSHREIAAEIGIGKSTVTDKVAKIKKIAMDLLDDMI
ncbi:MAG: helix-turn-helix domain-containing protein [Clostridium sp.]|uniref:helix-turn-helix domain-containing protein n=1 Tax=Clostridium sp. TaxID=1506 RepID=UPI0039E8CE1C